MSMCTRPVSDKCLHEANAAPLRLLARSVYSPHDRCIQLVLALQHVATIVFHSQYEYRQVAFFFEVLLGNRRWQDSVQIAFAVGGFVTMPSHIPSKDTNLVEVEGQAVFGLREQHQILRNFPVAVRKVSQY